MIHSSTLTQLYRDHWPRLVHTIAQRVTCLSTANDLAQEAYLRLLGQRDLAHETNLPAYLFRIGRNLVIDHQRKLTQPLINTTELHDDLPCSVAQPEQRAAARQECELLWAAMAELTQPIQRTLSLSLIEGVSHATIAVELGVTERTVQTYLRKGMAHCQRRLRDPLPSASRTSGS
ncbi:MAG: sigma-70 family RNA polymerase sigma factor [Thiobacillaceae bacterium]